MEVFLKIEHRKTSIFTEAKESTTVLELKHIVEGIMKRPPEDQLLFKDNQLLEERKTLWLHQRGNKVTGPSQHDLGLQGRRLSTPACPPFFLSTNWRCAEKWSRLERD
uniref:Ubiquitin-like domain-containing protein n=1 Tax=Rattus norvegicus TaxID=10116 RepID=A0A8I6AB06_RAT